MREAIKETGMKKLGWGRGNKRSVSLCVFIHVWIARPAVDSTPRRTRVNTTQFSKRLKTVIFKSPGRINDARKSAWEKAKQNKKERVRRRRNERKGGEEAGAAKVPSICAGLSALREGPRSIPTRSNKAFSLSSPQNTKQNGGEKGRVVVEGG